MRLKPLRHNFRRTLRRLLDDRSGTSVIEFALILPILLTLGMYGTELAYMATVRMQVSQMATAVADNASRLGQTDNSSVTPTVSESDVNSVMSGALRQGAPIDFTTHGRIILTSLERDAFSGKQYIHWQRCTGNLPRASSYGNDTNRNGLTGTPLPGMGSAGHRITASPGTAVMYAEVYFQYDGLFGDMFVDSQEFKQEAAFMIRDDRNLTPGVTGTGSTSRCA